MRHLMTIALAAALLQLPAAAQAQATAPESFPTKALRLVVPLPAGGPSDFIARQALPHLRPMHTGANLSRRGACVLAEADGAPREATLLATGSEVAIAMAARGALQASGTPTAVVSMPSWELFEAQDGAYRSSMLGSGTVRVGCEAAMSFGWERWLGERGAFVGMSGFGASGPAEQLYRHFGITPEAVAAQARRLLRSSGHVAGARHSLASP